MFSQEQYLKEHVNTKKPKLGGFKTIVSYTSGLYKGRQAGWGDLRIIPHALILPKFINVFQQSHVVH